jgi:hypothetical protein
LLSSARIPSRRIRILPFQFASGSSYLALSAHAVISLLMPPTLALAGVVAVAIYLPYPQHALMSYKRVYPLLFAGGAGILADDYWLTQHCLEFSRKQVRASKHGHLSVLESRCWENVCFLSIRGFKRRFAKGNIFMHVPFPLLLMCCDLRARATNGGAASFQATLGAKAVDVYQVQLVELSFQPEQYAPTPQQPFIGAMFSHKTKIKILVEKCRRFVNVLQQFETRCYHSHLFTPIM